MQEYIAIVDFFDEQDSAAFRIRAAGPDEAHDTIAKAIVNFDTITLITPQDEEYTNIALDQIVAWPA